MKRFALLLIMLFLLVGCQQEYHLFFIVNNELRTTTLDSFKANSDEEACKTAIEYIDSYMSISSNYEDAFYPDISYGINKGDKAIPINGNIYNNCRFSLEEYCPAYIKEQQNRIREEEKKAYGGAEFGMSRDEVKALSHYSDYSSYRNYLDAISEQIGNHYYKVQLFFDEDSDELFYVRLTSYSVDALDYDGKLRQYAEDLKSVIEKAYGKPTEDYGYPSFLSIQSGVLHMGYKWKIGTKEIRVGVGTDELSRARYCVYGMIEDTVRNGERNAKIQAMNDKQIQESADLF